MYNYDWTKIICIIYMCVNGLFIRDSGTSHGQEKAFQIDPLAKPRKYHVPLQHCHSKNIALVTLTYVVIGMESNG